MYNYPTNTNNYLQSFDVYVVQSCNVTTFDTMQDIVTNFEDVGLFGGPYV